MRTLWLKITALTPYTLAGVTALTFAYMVSETAYVMTGIQFVAPLAVILLSHLVWVGLSSGFVPGYAAIVVRRALATTVGLVALSMFAAIAAPMPAEANVEGAIQSGLIVLLCLFMVAVVLGAVGVVIFALYHGVAFAWRLFKRRSGQPPNSNGGVNDLGAMVVIFVLLGVASLEGVVGAYSFATSDQASSSVRVAAGPDRVWTEVGKATSPSYPLPVLLRAIPQPVAVLVDEGAALGARRIVRFRGREGEGDLTLQVSQRTETEVVFAVLEDTSPISMWVRQRALTYHVEPAGTGSELTVTLAFDRLLAPAWFFRPYVRLVAFFAVDVLARDTRNRAQMR